ncbi:hypothetical protein D3P06_00795 [Paracoccus aestuarii]|uniref:YubB ferredoxin-like domain-containing protein n=1 Tax=Paracoccus aestuarii TaxID=453842 RepID=A0A419A2Q8_9RHOB|nr:hypothetical protein [Paracoccus aestuarii]RJL07309.1 hypothetical protein D3P06_00795 [Paracoccus aestuarii]WCR00068.1 hypothetical protein JHW48_04995 [Paracoccus aestuarii]
MPNHVTNRVVVTGPSAAIAAFRAAFLVENVEADEDGKEHPFTRFDFNRIIPRPTILEQTESSTAVSMGLLVLGRPEIIKDGFGTPSIEAEVARYLGLPWVQEVGVTDYESLKTLLTQRDPGCVAKAEIAIRAYEECGHASWYSWSISNWGTKWNAYSFEVIEEREGRLEFRFDTAWSPPEPVFAALADHPECEDLRIDIQGFDEGWLFAYRAEISCGIYDIESITPTPELYAEIYGEPCVDEDGEAEDPVPGAAMI